MENDSLLLTMTAAENSELTPSTSSAPPDQPPEGGGGGEGGGEGGGGGEETPTLTGALQLDSGTKEYDGGESGATLSSTTSDKNVVLAQNEGTS